MSKLTRFRPSPHPGARNVPAVAIFARAPSPGRAKTRLMPLLGAKGAADFQAALIADTLRKVSSLGGRIPSYLFISGYITDCDLHSSDYFITNQRGRDLGERLSRAFRRLLRRHRAAIVIGTDSPLLPSRILRQGLDELRTTDAVLGPCPDGGYYLIGLRRMTPDLFAHVRWGTRYAFRDTVGNLLRRGYSCSILGPMADIDRPEDFRQLTKEFARSAAARRAAPAVWKFVKGFRSGRSASLRDFLVSRAPSRSILRPGLRRRHRRQPPGRA